VDKAAGPVGGVGGAVVEALRRRGRIDLVVCLIFGLLADRDSSDLRGDAP
jgi:hypothetical protein